MTMRLLVFLRSAFTIIAVGYVLTNGAGNVFACKCASGFHGKSKWELAKAEAQGTDVIFEGTPEHIEMQWGPLGTREGDLVPATSDAVVGTSSRMVITFRVDKSFKGDLGSEVQVMTGLGGGDCGASFSPGLSYLVYARKTMHGELSVNMCSPGGWIGASVVAVELRFLRHQQPILDDLKMRKQWSERGYAEQEKENARSLEEQAKRYLAATGTICGTVAVNGSRDDVFGLLSFLSTKNSSPLTFTHPTVDIRAGGAFCSGRLAPGKYDLHFMRFSEGELVSSVYFPGVNDRNQATTIEVRAGTSQAGFIFNVRGQKTYPVRGFISTDDRSGLTQGNVSVVLSYANGLPFPPPYVKTIDFQSVFPLPGVKYFHFDHVLPGSYIAMVYGPGPGWFTKKVGVIVTTHMKFISLELSHKN